MDIYMVVLTLVGVAFLGAAWVPHLVYRAPLSFPFLYVAFGFLLFALPLGLRLPNPLENSFFTERFTEVLVIISLAGAGLKLSRPLEWKYWMATGRLLLLAMPITIALTALFGWWVLGLAPASALLLGAVLAPTDPVLASDVQVGPPGDETEGETRFALTAEAGLNDGLAFPFTHLAIAATAAAGSGIGWLTEWALFGLLTRVTIGAVTGIVLGLLVSRFIFRMPASFGIASSRDGFVVVAITFLAYGVTELLHGYGFLAVFLAALTLRQQERDHPYQKHLHDFAAGLEQLLMTLMLILFGGLVAQGLLASLDVRMVVVAVAVLVLVRPLAGLLSLVGLRIPLAERGAISVFGIRGIGSLYYLAYAVNRHDFSGTTVLWQTVSLTILLSIVLHGASASFVMAHLDRENGRRERVS
jgi:NhaP-type Na+/H+ or K+/H+ antiporter